MTYLLGIDIGTSACKIAVFDELGKTIASATTHYNVYYPQSGYAEQSPDEWFAAVCTGCKELFANNPLINPADIACVGIDGQSWSAICIDKYGNTLYNTPIWFDTRASAICERVRSSVGEDVFFNICGNPFQPTYTTPKVLWYKENLPSLYNDTYQILQSNSFIVFKLTDTLYQDLSQGYGLHFFDMKTGQYNRDVCSLLDIDLSKFPQNILKCHEIAGYITQNASRLTGLMEGTPVVAGGLDAACGTLGTGVIHTGQTQEQGGTSGGMSICTAECLTNKLLICSQHVVHGRWLLQGGTTGGGGTMKWWNDNFGEYERSIASGCISPYQMYDEHAATVAPGSDGLIMLPYMAGERSPIWDASAKGVYFGIDYTKTKAHFIRALLEGAAFALKHNLETDKRIRIDTLYATGGSANSKLWTQIKADVTGCEIKVPTSDMGATLGAAVLAGVGIGIYSSFDDAVRKTISVKRVHTPNAELYDIYTRNYIKYLELYKSLKHLY